MDEQELITTEDAMKIAEKAKFSTTKQTVITWCSKYKLGFKVGGRWRVDRQKFKDFLKGHK